MNMNVYEFFQLFEYHRIEQKAIAKQLKAK